MTSIEVDMIVPNSLEALELYEEIFPVERIKIVALQTGLNEVVFSIYGMQFHLLDENPKYFLTIPTSEDASPMWLTVLVTDVEETFGKALSAGCKEVHPLIKMPGTEQTRATFSDPFGYTWVLSHIKESVLEQNMAVQTEKKFL